MSDSVAILTDLRVHNSWIIKGEGAHDICNSIKSRKSFRNCSLIAVYKPVSPVSWVDVPFVMSLETPLETAGPGKLRLAVRSFNFVLGTNGEIYSKAASYSRVAVKNGEGHSAVQRPTQKTLIHCYATGDDDIALPPAVLSCMESGHTVTFLMMEKDHQGIDVMIKRVPHAPPMCLKCLLNVCCVSGR